MASLLFEIHDGFGLSAKFAILASYSFNGAYLMSQAFCCSSDMGSKDMRLEMRIGSGHLLCWSNKVVGRA